jgi:hypothetical protein
VRGARRSSLRHSRHAQIADRRRAVAGAVRHPRGSCSRRSSSAYHAITQTGPDHALWIALAGVHAGDGEQLVADLARAEADILGQLSLFLGCGGALPGLDIASQLDNIDVVGGRNVPRPDRRLDCGTIYGGFCAGSCRLARHSFGAMLVAGTPSNLAPLRAHVSACSYTNATAASSFTGGFLQRVQVDVTQFAARNMAPSARASVAGVG